MRKRAGLKREGEGLESDNSKKQKIDDDQEEAEMKNLIEIIMLLKGIKTAKLVLLVQKLLLLVMKVNTAGIKVTTPEGLQLLKG
ncbi:hypothetical protein Tco_0287374 [Tanacetum coccineum]